MILLVGDACSKEQLRIMEKYGWGRMLTKSTGQISPEPYKNEPIGFDNRAYPHFLSSESFNEYEFLNRIKKAEILQAHIIVAVTPDIVKGGSKSLELSNFWIKRLPKENSFPWYLAVQDGMNVDAVENSLTTYHYQGVFLGGSNSFKNLQGKVYANLAKKYGLKFHYGRCGTKRKLRHANNIGADSCDSAFPIYWKPRVEGIVKELKFLTDKESKYQMKIDKICPQASWLGFLGISCANNLLHIQECYPHKKPKDCPKYHPTVNTLFYHPPS